MATLNTYLNFPGNTEEAFEFYRSVFGGELTLHRFVGTPGSENLSPEDQQKVMHVELPIGKGNLLMGTDVLESMGQSVTPGTQISLSLNVDSETEAEHLFYGLSAGGTVSMPLEKMFWNAYFGAFTDKFGVQWMVNYDYSAAA